VSSFSTSLLRSCILAGNLGQKIWTSRIQICFNSLIAYRRHCKTCLLFFVFSSRYRCEYRWISCEWKRESSMSSRAIELAREARNVFARFIRFWAELALRRPFQTFDQFDLKTTHDTKDKQTNPGEQFSFFVRISVYLQIGVFFLVDLTNPYNFAITPCLAPCLVWRVTPTKTDFLIFWLSHEIVVH